MIVKFIVVGYSDGTHKILFSKKAATHCMHAAIAKNNGISSSQIRGGGLADLEKKRIFGMSIGFGKYNTQYVRELLPDWQVEESSSETVG